MENKIHKKTFDRTMDKLPKDCFSMPELKAIDRLCQYFHYKEINPAFFEKKINVANGYFGIQKRRNANLGEGVLKKIIDNCSDIDPTWLLTGEGEMLRMPGKTALGFKEDSVHPHSPGQSRGHRPEKIPGIHEQVNRHEKRLDDLELKLERLQRMLDLTHRILEADLEHG